eukprot:15361893-Ditylum_brightwellii.AAC.1
MGLGVLLMGEVLDSGVFLVSVVLGDMMAWFGSMMQSRGNGRGKAHGGFRLISVSFLLKVTVLNAMGCCSSCS